MRNAILSVVVVVGLSGVPAWADVVPISDGPEISGGDISPSSDEPSDIDESSCNGDLDRNGVVDGTDLAAVLNNYGRCRGCNEDLDEDGSVDQADVDMLLRSWGRCSDEVEREAEPADLSRSIAATGGNEIEEDLPEPNRPDEAEPKCPGDLDGDGTINSTDLAMLLLSYGRCYNCAADLSGDGYVDQDDIDRLMRSWGDCDEVSFSDVARDRPSLDPSPTRD